MKRFLILLFVAITLSSAPIMAQAADKKADKKSDKKKTEKKSDKKKSDKK